MKNLGAGGKGLISLLEVLNFKCPWAIQVKVSSRHCAGWSWNSPMLLRARNTDLYVMSP